MADLILDSAAAGQLVAVTDGDYDGGLEEKGIPSLQRQRKKKDSLAIHFKTKKEDETETMCQTKKS